MKDFLRAGVLGLITCFLGTVFPAKEAPEKFFLCVKDIILFSSCDRGLHNDCIFSFIKKIIQNEILVFSDGQRIKLALYSKECEEAWPKKTMNFVKKDRREECFLKFKSALEYIGEYILKHEETLEKNEINQYAELMSLEALKNDVCALEQFYIKGNKDRMINEFLGDLYALFEFFYCYPRGGYENSGDYHGSPSFKPCEGLFEAFFSWVSMMFAYDFSIKNPFWADENKKLFLESIDEFKKPESFCKKENLFELRKNFCEALFHIPYHVERYENFLRGEGQTNKQYFLALTEDRGFCFGDKEKIYIVFSR